MKINLYSPVYFENWDWSNSTEEGKGIGGSETCHTELAWRFAQRGHTVNSYSPLPPETSSGSSWRNTTWYDLQSADWDEGHWLLFRDMSKIDEISSLSPKSKIWLVCQDEFPAGLTKERIKHCHRFIALCQWHKSHLVTRFGVPAEKIFVSSNGLKVDLIDETSEQIRNPKKLIYASSPDRGLLPLLKIFRRAKEFTPDLELHCFYGTNNMEKLIDFDPKFKRYAKFIDKLKEELNQKDVFWHGRVGQRELYNQWKSSGLWVYPNVFGESSCICCFEAQSMGAIPITRPFWALAENVTHGIFIQGDPNSDPLVRARYVAAITVLANNPELQENIREKMMPEARQRFNWERIVDQMENWMIEDEEGAKC